MKIRALTPIDELYAEAKKEGAFVLYGRGPPRNTHGRASSAGDAVDVHFRHA